MQLKLPLFFFADYSLFSFVFSGGSRLLPLIVVRGVGDAELPAGRNGTAATFCVPKRRTNADF